jgi:hypothetical protein
VECGVEGNESADSVAKQSITEDEVSEIVLPATDLEAKWRKKRKE